MRLARFYIIILFVGCLATPLSAQTQTTLPDSVRCPHCGELFSLKEIIRHGETSSVPGKQNISPGDINSSEDSLSVRRKPDQVEKGFLEKLKSSPLFYPFLGLLGIIAVLVYYFLAYLPNKRRKPLIEALKIIEENIEAKFQQADDLLSKALTVGLKDHEVAEARFAQGYVRARLQNYAEASAVIEELKKNPKQDRETIYLDLWLQSRQENHQEVEKIYNEHHKRLGNFLDTGLIASIAFLELGKEHWSRNEFELAIHFFDKVKQLEILKDRLPKHIDDHQIILGIMSLFDNQIDEARRYFNGAITSAEKEKKQNWGGQLGLLLCEWKERDLPNIDEKLGAIVKEMEKSVEEDKSEEQEEKLDSAEEEKDILLRNVLLWHVVSLIFTWFQLPEKSGLPETQKEKLTGRLNKVKVVDPDMPDPYLIQGLIDYFFSYDIKREEAVKTLQQALEKGVNVPEVINLVDREVKLLEQESKTLELFLNLLKKYLSDKTIPFDLREELKNRLGKFSRFKELEEGLNISAREEESMPSIVDLQNRGLLLHKRVNNIVKPKLAQADSQEAKNINDLMEGLTRTTEEISNGTKKLEETEQALMLRTGEFLFNEEE